MVRKPGSSYLTGKPIVPSVVEGRISVNLYRISMQEDPY